MHRLFVALLLATCGHAAARADASSEVTITLNAEGAQLAQELGLDVESFRAQAADKLAAAMQISEVQRFLRSFANATSFSNRGIGVDYGSNSERYIFGVAANLAVSADLGEDSEIPTVGIAPSFALMGGVNLRRWNHPALTLYANLFHATTDGGQLRGGITNVGLHGQYKLFTPTRGTKRLLVQWGGLDVTTGVEVARWSFGLGGELSTGTEIAGVGLTSMITGTVGGNFDVGATTVTIPLELTTNLRLLYVLSAYLGGGLDAQLGHASIGADVAGSLRGTSPTSGTDETIGAISARADGANRPSRLGYHLLAGLQANLWRFKVFTQLSLQPSDELNVSLALGARVVL